MSTKSYIILERDSGKILKSGITEDALVNEVDSFIETGHNIAFIEETAAAGSVGAGSIAVRFDGKSDIKPLTTIKAFMDQFNARVQNRFTPHEVSPKNFTIKIDEAFDIESVFSRLGSMERAGSKKKTEGTTFGIEDDNGNIMRVTVRAEQATEFEEEVAKYIADIKMNLDGLPSPKESKELSMAELLFNLKDKFDIIDVDFPKIPKDVIYNADKASVGAPTEPTEGMPEDELGADFDTGEPLDLTDTEQTEEPVPAEDEGMGDFEEDMLDDESVEDFQEEPVSDESSILSKVLDMLKAQAEAEIEKSKAEAESARAEQAKYTAQATQNAIRDEEEALRYEVEMEEQKRKEKEAQKRIDMAKHRIAKTMSAASGAFTEGFAGVESTRSVMNDKRAIMLRWKPEPDDTPEQIAEKRAMQNEELKVWAARLRMARRAEMMDSKNKRKEADSKRAEQKQAQDTNPDNNANQQQPEPKRGF